MDAQAPSAEEYDLAQLQVGQTLNIVTVTGTVYRLRAVQTPTEVPDAAGKLVGIVVRDGQNRDWRPDMLVKRTVAIGKPFVFGLIGTRPVQKFWEST